ncbi:MULTISPECIES: hypothetical protein [unclassified Roseofilum]|uniref:hypothetical protein n=1 Tax=unclassified Roseofilum TaxID=2620099 RepID=UPI000E93E531|nr:MULTISPECIES: hypothetical protein [unclassified Roseofilum]HBQ99783.1 hypothetical protein [Cyanobacteria bacterium UBA11691]MBP0006836.1 hypothetical protein [Roseofilum sp. Belize Diploria]MBP0023555.1 hypothetical protein [Roseofilum sp. SID2]MBP0035395.1 hypothetical protein [Roseofilum sp. Belize BBD 4]MBP0043931.1 hypothetical protein [Roseofilum sp. SBFL]
MSITSRSLQKLLRENISGTKPLSVNLEQAKDLAEDLLARVEPLAGAERHNNCHHYHRFQRRSSTEQTPSNTLCCCILLEESSERWYRNHTHLHLFMSPEQQLWVELGGERSPAPVSDLSEMVALIQAFFQRVDRQKAQAAKRQKQKDLKVQAILAQVRKIAKEDQFDFATEVDTVKLKLIIRLSDNNDYFAILIPFNQFKEVLPKLRTAIQALRETYNSGVRFTTRLKRGYGRSSWIRHQDL